MGEKPSGSRAWKALHKCSPFLLPLREGKWYDKSRYIVRREKMHPEEAVLFFPREGLREGSHTELNSVCGCVGGYSTEREL